MKRQLRAACLLVAIVVAGMTSVGGPSSAATIRKALSGQEGAGPGWCSQYGGYTLGAEFDGVYACGPSWGEADPFDSVGFQCVELSARFMWVMHREYVVNVPSGGEFVAYGHAQFHIPVGVPGPDSVPSPGDIVSIWGGDSAAGVGHTAVVAAVHVNGQGNGSIRIMEENASGSGWGKIGVSHWAESYGGPSTISWLNFSGQPVGHFGRTLHYAVQPLGSHMRIMSLNNSGSAAGLISFTTADGFQVQRPFISRLDRVSVLPAPSSVGELVENVAINDKGRLAVSAGTHGMPSTAFTVAPYRGRRWTRLPNPIPNPAASAALAVNDRSAIAGWVAPRTNPSHTLGVVWSPVHNGYQSRLIRPSAGFVAVRLYGVDRVGDVIGTETSTEGQFYPVLWVRGGSMLLLPSSMKGASGPGTATALWLEHGAHPGLTVIGSSTVKSTGAVESTAWKIRIVNRVPHLQEVHHLGMISQSQLSLANGISGRGWIVGDSVAPKRGHRSPFAFLRRPKRGLLPLSLMVSSNRSWNIVDAESVNVRGQVVASGYWRQGSHRGRTEALLLNPVG